MIKGNVKKINLSTSHFARIIERDTLYVDKTRMIENFLNADSDVQLIARQRRLGKSLNMDMLRCFLTDREDLRHLFKGLYIEKSPVWDKAYSAPVFYFDFKGLQPKVYREQIIDKMIAHVCAFVDPESLDFALKRKFQRIVDNPEQATECLYFLTELAFKLTGKRSYLLIDEYDKLLMSSYDSNEYEELRAFETALLSAALKGNEYLEKALLTGVMRISHESMLSGLNNIVTFDVFGDDMYTDDYGMTEEEVEELSRHADFDIAGLRQWYNGVRIAGKPIYNIYSVMSYLSRREYECFWGKSGTMDMIITLLNGNRCEVLARLLSGEQVEVSITNRISLRQLSAATGDQAFYSLLVQAGYLALTDAVLNKSTTATVTIPNTELMIVWKDFILQSFHIDTPKARTLFDNADNLEAFAADLEYFLRDRLSYHDLAVFKGEERTHERLYHVFLLGILSAYEDVRCKHPLSNRESGAGRYDILVEKPNGYFIFEFKACKSETDLETEASSALSQIETRRYGTDLSGGKPLVKIGAAFCGKMCRVKCG